MCGIAGIVGLKAVGHFAKSDDPQAIVRRMTDRIAHRGPDAEGLWQGSDVVLGHRRLSIIDLSAASNQPMTTPDGRYTIVFNGEIYNYRVLRKQLGDVAWRSGGDGEVLLHAWARWGADCLPKLEGMFAFALWDEQEQECVLVRDRLGIKPLYYSVFSALHEAGSMGLGFASEIRALLASRALPSELDQDALTDYLRYGTVHAPKTIVSCVRMLLPGRLLRFNGDQGVREESEWWGPVKAARKDAQVLPMEAVTKETRTLLAKAVEKRLVADVPFGAFLSGGIDSSAVVGLMAECSSAPVHTFNVSFDESQFSEARYAQIIAKRFNTQHTEIKLKPADMLRYLPDALAAMDHPSMDGPNTWVVSKVTKQAGITMALSGLGGDEVFAGYDVFQRSTELQRKAWLMAVPKTLRKLAGSVLAKARPSAASTKAAELLALDDWSLKNTYPLSRLAFTDAELRTLLRNDMSPINAVRFQAEVLLGGGGGDKLPLLSRVSLLEMCTYMQNVLLRDTDQMSMAHALEVRVPFLDHDLVSFVLGVGDAFKYPHTPKQLLTESLGDLLPREIIDRPKMGFTLPWAQWMRGELKTFCSDRMTALAARDQFNSAGVTDLWQRFLANDPRVTWGRVWMLVVLEDWMQRNGVQA
ncbi:MAG: asparagine synthase (glutamine-hydrolyzing) [Flavobacteriales bacterium]|nr:MAG: asparagine synthase (glutamine-hydrolyzing) [Flavobacteriales bacterium]